MWQTFSKLTGNLKIPVVLCLRNWKKWENRTTWGSGTEIYGIELPHHVQHTFPLVTFFVHCKFLLCVENLWLSLRVHNGVVCELNLPFVLEIWFLFKGWVWIKLKNVSIFPGIHLGMDLPCWLVFCDVLSDLKVY